MSAEVFHPPQFRMPPPIELNRPGRRRKSNTWHSHHRIRGARTSTSTLMLLPLLGVVALGAVVEIASTGGDGAVVFKDEQNKYISSIEQPDSGGISVKVAVNAGGAGQTAVAIANDGNVACSGTITVESDVVVNGVSFNDLVARIATLEARIPPPAPPALPPDSPPPPPALPPPPPSPSPSPPAPLFWYIQSIYCNDATCPGSYSRSGNEWSLMSRMHYGGSPLPAPCGDDWTDNSGNSYGAGQTLTTCGVGNPSFYGSCKNAVYVLHCSSLAQQSSIGECSGCVSEPGWMPGQSNNHGPRLSVPCTVSQSAGMYANNQCQPNGR